MLVIMFNMDINQLVINTKIEEYLKKNLVKMEDLNKEIEKINLIYEEIIELNGSIKDSEFISLDDLPAIKKQSDDCNKLHNLKEQLRYLRKETYNRMINKLQQYNMNDLNRKISKLNYIGQRNSWKNIIHNYWYEVVKKLEDKKQFLEQKILKRDLSLLAIEIIRINLQKKLRLKEIYKEYYSEDFVKELLAELYKKEIEIIQKNLKGI